MWNAVQLDWLRYFHNIFKEIRFDLLRKVFLFPFSEVTEFNFPHKKQTITMLFKATSPEELSLKQGDQIAVLNVPEKSDDRLYVVKFRSDGSEEARGWIPKYVLEEEKEMPEGKQCFHKVFSFYFK